MSNLLKKITHGALHAGCILLILAFGLSGCVSSGKPQLDTVKFLLSYPAPSREESEIIQTSLKLNRFSIAAAYNTTGMIFRPDDYSMDSFNYSRWAVNPADMIADCLLHDLRGSGLFSTVFSRYEPEEGRFSITGGIEEFYLRMDKSSQTALISMTLSLQDRAEKETVKKMMYQKKYVREVALQEKSPKGYCEAASRALQAMSREIINDIHTTVKARTSKAQDEP
jgi:ABC-type uncharacterized transport system auxiliary subunit